MDTFELNKYAGAILGSLLILFVINAVGNLLVHPAPPEKAVIAIELPESAATEEETKAAEAKTEEKSEEKAEATTAAAAPAGGLGALIAAADAARGQKLAKKCAACHTFDKGGKNKIGPNLYGVVGRAKAAVEGYKYSAALAGFGGDWSFADMAAFLAKPKAFLKGTKMTFAGIKTAEDRAALIAFMLQFHDSPPALPGK
ncbi:MAG: cytochrome c family protein [Alphaproteobacteria bacterium]|jgi:cytochrome c|nr:cytochrome c family protein [Alphaproteobacteria bacterium]